MDRGGKKEGRKGIERGGEGTRKEGEGGGEGEMSGGGGGTESLPPVRGLNRLLVSGVTTCQGSSHPPPRPQYFSVLTIQYICENVLVASLVIISLAGGEMFPHPPSLMTYGLIRSK